MDRRVRLAVAPRVLQRPSWTIWAVACPLAFLHLVELAPRWHTNSCKVPQTSPLLRVPRGLRVKLTLLARMRLRLWTAPLLSTPRCRGTGRRYAATSPHASDLVEEMAPRTKSRCP